MQDNLIDKFTESLYSLSQKSITKALFHQANRCLLDYLGATFIGAKMLQSKCLKLLDQETSNSGSVLVVGMNRKTNIENAIFVNGLNSHVAEFDDGIRYGMLHPGAPIISALLPVAQIHKVSKRKLLLGIIVGYEAAIRLAHAIQPAHYNYGYHPTSTCGTIGAAVGISVMLGYNKKQLKNAISAATVSVSGSLKVIEDESELKPFNSARASVNGYLAANIAFAGFNSPKDCFGGDTGFFSMFSDMPDFSIVEFGYGEILGIEKVYVKPYASCRHAHPAIEAALLFRASSIFNISNIEAINIYTYSSIIGKHDHKHVAGESSARMSIPYSVAVTLVTGKAGISEYSSIFYDNPIITSLMNRVFIYSDEAITAQVPEKRSAIVEFIDIHGQNISYKIDFPKGEPENPVTDAELIEKFNTLAVLGGKSLDVVNAILNSIWTIEDNLDDLFSLL